MTITEFTKLTGFIPEQSYFDEVIHVQYMNAGNDVDKETFCKKWKHNGGIQDAYNVMVAKNINAKNAYNTLNMSLNTLMQYNERLQASNKYYKELLNKINEMTKI